jgi:GntR family transcriptional regulator
VKITVQVNRKNPLPLYIQLKELIIDKIENEVWLPGELIPTEAELQKQYNLSRTTVRQALSELVSNGILERIQGKGTYVSEPKLEPIRPDLTGFTKDMGEKGHQVSSIIMNQGMETVNEKVQKILQVDANTPVFKLDRIRLVDGVCIGSHEAFLNLAALPLVNITRYDFAKQSLYEALVEEGVAFGESDETVEASLANDLEANLLKIPLGSAVLKLTRFTKLEDGRPFEFTKMVYRADKYKYSIKLK